MNLPNYNVILRQILINLLVSLSIFFIAKLRGLKKIHKVMKSSTNLNSKKYATLISYEVARLVAKSGKDIAF